MLERRKMNKMIDVHFIVVLVPVVLFCRVNFIRLSGCVDVLNRNNCHSNKLW